MHPNERMAVAFGFLTSVVTQGDLVTFADEPGEAYSMFYPQKYHGTDGAPSTNGSLTGIQGHWCPC